MTAGRELRVATLFAAPAVAAIAALPVRSAQLLSTTAPVLAALWAIMIAALAARAIQDARRRDKPPTDLRPAWHQLDVLTATGSSVAWTAAAALIACGVTGWASLSVLGVLGLGAVFVAATWTAVAAGGDAPWRRATIARAIVPELATEGEPLRDQVQLTGIRIPAGMRLFATSRALPDGATARHAIGSGCSLADVRLDAELGAARRGEHCAAPLTLWLGDVLGLTRTQPVEHGEVRFAVLPRPVPVDGVRALLGAGGDDAAPQPTARQPTDGTFRIRNYLPGDDARRIHWVRSLQTRRLVVRLADEIPHAEPAVRLVLDSELCGADDLTCRAPRELLDALVRIWLGVGRALTDAGIRVTLVAAGAGGANPALDRRRPLAGLPHWATGTEATPPVSTISASDGHGDRASEVPRGIEPPLTSHTTRDARQLGGFSRGPRAIELPLTPHATRDALHLGGSSNRPCRIELPLTSHTTRDTRQLGGFSRGPRAIELPLTPHATRDALHLGGQVAWQTALPLAALLAEGATVTRQVVVSSRPRKPSSPPRTAWIVVPECAWTSPEAPVPERQLVVLPFPSGCADNRLTRRAQARRDHAQMQNDRTMFSQVICLTELATFSGELVARPRRGGVTLEAIP